MLGPLPPLYRWLVGVMALLACIGLGAWLAFLLPVPLVAPTRAAIGAVLGAVVVLVLLLGGDQRPPTTRPRHR